MKGEKIPMEEQQLLTRVYNILFSKWRAQKQQRNEIWISDAYHQCNTKERCAITNFYVRVYEYSHPVTKQSELHICEGECSKHVFHRAGSLRATITNVFICEHTGKFHVCTAGGCSEPSIRSANGEQVCRMSGLTRSHEFHDTYTAPVDKCNYAVSNSRKRKLVDLSASQQQQQGSKGKEEEEWLSKLNLDSKSKNITLQLVDLLLFNKKRRDLEMGRIKKMMDAAKGEVITYKRRCERSEGKIVCVMYAAAKYTKKMQDCRPPPYIDPGCREAAERVVEYYAHFCMLMYAKFIKYVFVNNKKEDAPSLKECVPAILYIMREGLKTSAGDILITEDMFIDKLLPEENTLDHFDIKKTQFTKTKKRITEDTAYSIEVQCLCVAKLSITPLCMEDIIDVRTAPLSQLFIQANPDV